MAQIVITCPKTGNPVPTGMDMDRESFESGTFVQLTLKNCPECGDDHTWDTKDAQLSDD